MLARALLALLLASSARAAWAESGAPSPGSAAAGTPAARLGEAWRAFETQSFARAYELAAGIERQALIHDDYVRYVLAQSSFFLGRPDEALGHFRALAGAAGSRFRELARWRVADCLWALGRTRPASSAYAKLVAAAAKQRSPDGDIGLARYRIAAALVAQKRKQPAMRALREFLREHPEHPMAEQATADLRALGGAAAVSLSPRDRLARAQTLTAERRLHQSYAELAAIGDEVDAELRRERDYWQAMTLFKMRRRYEDAGRTLLSLYKQLGGRAAMAMFHGARALSRADRDREAIDWYQRVAAEYPRTIWAAEAQFLAGWLAFNLGDYDAAIPLLERTLDRYGDTKWQKPAHWFLGFSHFLSGNPERALPHFERLARQRDKLEGGQGRYWHARALQELGRVDEANRSYRELVAEHPFSWYALLSRARLGAHGDPAVQVDPFGRPLGQRDDDSRAAARVPALDTQPSAAFERDALIRAGDELLAAGLPIEAGVELRRGEYAYLKRHRGDKAAAMAVLLERYRRARNFNRPWMLAVVHGGWRALNSPPVGRARTWWEHAYPRAYRDLVERWHESGGAPANYLYAIMRKESGFDPHLVSYADARGLMQMIPPTTRKVAAALELDYTEDMLYDPALNVRVGAWYIGRLFRKFKQQVPIAAGSYNAGPRAAMRWLRRNGQRPMDEYVELISYKQTRGYMKKVPETYARYLYLYEGVVYEQPLVVDAEYIDNDLTY
ncbi:Lytic transglycosylase catalytic [Haliangium ochraceum DSM 14365]|uniref:Lytic transglycosylase catalytic n=1 Tax=Haliangium ochraceum (strain DSM 14365 / JCM 11303 / SMP-2) TaxID=502025 RepID=D0LIY8_HALO1|nr:Lytic transglycosylase catalytic [Haliangium ochraceum DSM 14365]